MLDGRALFRVQSDAQARVKAQMQDISIINPQERCRRLRVQRRGNINQTDQSCPRATVIWRVGR